MIIFGLFYFKMGFKIFQIRRTYYLLILRIKKFFVVIRNKENVKEDIFSAFSTFFNLVESESDESSVFLIKNKKHIIAKIEKIQNFLRRIWYSLNL